MVNTMCNMYDEARADRMWRELIDAIAPREITFAQKIHDIMRTSRAYSSHATNLMVLIANCALAFYVMRTFSRIIMLFARILVATGDIVATIREFLKPGAITWVVTTSSCEILRDMDNIGFAIYIAYIACSNFSIFLALIPFITFAIFARSMWSARHAQGVPQHVAAMAHPAMHPIANARLAQAA